MGIKESIVKKAKNWSIQTLIAISFTVLMAIGMAFLGVSLYNVFGSKMEESLLSSSELLVDQTAQNLESYLRNLRRIASSINYNVIKEKDLATDSYEDEMYLLYEANSDDIVSIACFDSFGNLIASAPVSTKKSNANVTGQDWFKNAKADDLNLVFSTPHIQNLFSSSSYEYHRVISLSQDVEYTRNRRTYAGVLVIDLNYQSIARVFEELNKDDNASYSYLMDGEGNFVYHPKMNMINAGLYEEQTTDIEALSDGTGKSTFNGEEYLYSVRTISYTGWKLIRVTPASAVSVSMRSTRYFVIMIVLLGMIILTILTGIISVRITRPLAMLNESIESINEEDMSGTVYRGGSSEIKYLSDTIQSLIERIRKLMGDIVKEQEEKRKSELDALQSQINPHFLYNTLDSIVWMIEGEKNKDAIFMVRQLASLFRISLSKGKTIIPLRDEIKHAENYMNIQKVRYQNKFEVTFDIDEEILDNATVKLILQPILENSLYYGIEALDGDGEITVKGYKINEDVYISIRDNGMGMPKEVAEHLLEEGNHVPKHGSGVGLINIQKRIQIRFGKQYGLKIESEPDEGTIVTVHLPYRKYEGGDENA